MYFYSSKFCANLILGRAGTFDENNDDPEVVMKFAKKNKKQQKSKKTVSKREKISPKKEVKTEVNWESHNWVLMMRVRSATLKKDKSFNAINQLRKP